MDSGSDSQYRIIRKIGAGGMGEIYLAEDTRLGRKVALKLLPAGLTSDPARLTRFEREAKAASARRSRSRIPAQLCRDDSSGVPPPCQWVSRTTGPRQGRRRED